jgi:hypothetical protein
MSGGGGEGMRSYLRLRKLALGATTAAKLCVLSLPNTYTDVRNVLQNFLFPIILGLHTDNFSSRSRINASEPGSLAGM